METKPFELTREQKARLQSLSQELDKPISTLIDEALEGLQAQVCPVKGEVHREADGNKAQERATQPEAADKPIWERIQDAFSHVPEDELESLPVDGAAQVDHYAYGLPKR